MKSNPREHSMEGEMDEAPYFVEKIGNATLLSRAELHKSIDEMNAGKRAYFEAWSSDHAGQAIFISALKQCIEEKTKHGKFLGVGISDSDALETLRSIINRSQEMWISDESPKRKSSKERKISACLLEQKYTHAFLVLLDKHADEIVQSSASTHDQIDERTHQLQERIRHSTALKVDFLHKRSEVAVANVRLVRSIANDYTMHDTIITVNDLVDEGVFGLMSAIDYFDTSLGNEFSTYAMHWIRQSILNFLKNKTRVIKIGDRDRNKMSRLRSFEHAARAAQKPRPDDRDITRELMISIDDVRLARAHGTRPSSLTAVIRGSDDTYFSDIIPGKDDGTVAERNIDSSLLRQNLLIALYALSARQRLIVNLHKGLGIRETSQEDSQLPMFSTDENLYNLRLTIQVVSTLLGTARQRIEHILKEAQVFLRSSNHPYVRKFQAMSTDEPQCKNDNGSVSLVPGANIAPEMLPLSLILKEGFVPNLSRRGLYLVRDVLTTGLPDLYSHDFSTDSIRILMNALRKNGTPHPEEGRFIDRHGNTEVRTMKPEEIVSEALLKCAQSVSAVVDSRETIKIIPASHRATYDIISELQNIHSTPGTELTREGLNSVELYLEIVTNGRAVRRNKEPKASIRHRVP